MSEARPLSPFFTEPSLTSFGIAHLLGLTFERTPTGPGQVRIQVDSRLMHPQQIVHGGIIFTLADTAMSMALSDLIPPGTPFGTIEAKINYLLPVRAGELVARGKVLHEGGSTAVVEGTVYNLDQAIDGGRERAIAQVLGTFYIKRQKRAENR
ncbi:MAG TPA: PaaI family thioesterase [Ktedonobacteraceae bacterium]